MKKTVITGDFLKPYFDGQKKHKAYDITCNLYKDLRIHANGEKPGELITERRPGEDPKTQEYREKIYVAITESVISKIILCLSKIRRSHDWSIKYDNSKIDSRIQKGETLEEFCEKKFPYMGSVTNWLFSVALTNYLIDPNAVCVVMPIDTNIGELEFLQPFSYIFNSDNVYDYVQDDYLIALSTDKATYTTERNTYHDGKVYYVVTTDVIQRWEQVDHGGKMEQKFEWAHGLGRLPAFKMGGIFKEALDTSIIYKSRINSTIPHLKEAVREYSDLQAEVVQHIHSTMWAYVSEECKTCKGSGEIKKGTKSVQCEKCKGEGNKLFNPFSYLEVKPTVPGQPAVPTPPAGFVEKQIEIAKLQDERVDKHKYNALAAVNMEFLYSTPLNQSGKAKEVDRDELNNFVHSVAEDLVKIADLVYYFINEHRNRVKVKELAKRLEQLPVIPVPEKYDLLSSMILMEEMTKAKPVVNMVLYKHMELEYASKKFNNDPLVKQELDLVLNLDPLACLSDDQKMSGLQNMVISKQDYVISCYITSFVKRALLENKGFYKLQPPEQMKTIKTYADEKIKETSAAAAVMKVLEKDPAKAAV